MVILFFCVIIWLFQFNVFEKISYGIGISRQCPLTLVSPLIKLVIDEIRKSCKKHPLSYGFNPTDNAYEPLKLMQTVMAKTNEICLRYLDNSMLCSLPSPGPPMNPVSVYAVKNTRRRMEDRHVVIHDLNTMFNIQEASPSSYYAIFDGHAGHDAAAYSAAHLHQFLAENKHFEHNPEQALYDAFCKTDASFIDKCKVEKFGSGTTAVCALLRPKEKTLYIAWVGDSLALLVNQGRVLQCVTPHKPSREDEKNRIEQQGGVVVFWGTWRVNGQLAVSRAIGDSEYKPYVIATPDVREIPLSGGEDFLILACDGLWDFLSEDDAACTVYDLVCTNPDDIESISQRLVQLAKQQGSSDNISVIVVFLREPSKIAAEAHWANRNRLTMDAGLDNANATNNPFANSNGTEILSQKEGFLLNLNDGFKQNGSEISPTNEYLSFERSKNGKRSADEFDEDEDMGPETDIDAVDDISLSPSTEHTTKTISENKVDDSFDPFATDLEDKVSLELDLNLQKQQSSEFDSVRTPREETPTPPADEVHDVVVGLEENVGDSGEDSEDEWNYYKGDTAEKESISKADQEVAKITEAEENSEAMSQLNPDAAEFVPISSPTRSTASPACRGLINDTVIAQSPRRVTPTEIDINLPNPQEFEKEVKSRPSDVYSNGDESDSDHKLTSQEVMENLLNGKNIDEIEFHPSTPTKYSNPEEFHFGPNAAPFSTPAKHLDQSETALSTKAVFGEESTASYLEGKSLAFESSFLDTAMSKSFQSEDTQDFQALNKEQDPMSTSFYQDKDNENYPFDLNKVQVLPDNEDSDDYLLQKQTVTETLNDTISDLPEHNPLENADVIIETIDKTTPIEVEVNVRQTSPDLLTPDLTEDSSQLPSKSPTEELTEDMCSRLSSKSPGILTPEPADDVCQVPAPKSPTLITPEPTEEVCQLPPKSPLSDVDQFISKSPVSLTPEPGDEVCRIGAKSPEPAAQLISQSPEPTSEVCKIPSKSSAPLTPEPAEEELCKFSSKSPVALTPEPSEDLYKFSSKSPVALTPEPTEDVCKLSSKSPVALTPEPSEDVCKLSSKSPVALTPEPSEDICKLSSKSPVALTPEPSEDVCKLSSKSPVALTPEPSEDVCKLSSKSPVALSPEPSEDVCKLPSKSPVALSPEPSEDVCKLSSKSPVALSPEPSEDVCKFSSKSPAVLTPEPTEDICKLSSKSPVALSPEPTEAVCQFSSKSPVAHTPEPAEDLCKLTSKSPFSITPEPEDVCKVTSKSPVALTPEPTENHPSKSPELFEPEIPSKSPAVDEAVDLLGEDLQEPAKLSEPTEDMYLGFSKSPTALVPEQVEIVCNLSNKATEPLDDLCQFSVKQSELSAKTQESTHELVQEFTEVAEHQLAKSPELFGEIERKEVFSPEPKAVELECNLPSFKSPVLDSPESPMEDITSSVKDDVASSINTPTEEIQQITAKEAILETGSLNFAQELSSAVQEVVTSPFEEKALPEPSPKSAINEQVETESVATADINSFLERSNLTDITSPLSLNESATLLQFDSTYINDPLARCEYPLPQAGETLATKREVIEPEFPIKEIASPSEETPEEVKVEALKEEAPAASIEANAGDDSNIAEVATAAVAATAATALAGAAVVAVSSVNEKKPAKPKATTAITRKSTTKPSTSPIKAPSKTATPKPSATSPTKAATTTRVSKTSVSPKAAPSPAKAPLPTKPPVSKPAVPKQRPAAATTKPTEKKAADEKKLVNGDIKSTITRTLHVAAKKTTTTTSAPNSASKTASAPRTSASAKLSPAKTPTESSKLGSLTRPSTAPGKTATARPTTTAPRARPTSLTTKTSTASSSTTTRTNLAVSTTKSTSLTKSSTATSPKTSTAKPRTATTTTVPLHQRTKPTPKGPDTEKQLKETANKQLTASRTTSSTTRSATGKTTTTLQKTETKAPGSRTIATKTTVTTIKSAKKPLEITRNVSKTKTTTTKTTKVEQNGLSNGITITQETTAIISSDPQMIKDLSPVETKLITDNSQLPEANFAD